MCQDCIEKRKATRIQRFDGLRLAAEPAVVSSIVGPVRNDEDAEIAVPDPGAVLRLDLSKDEEGYDGGPAGRLGDPAVTLQAPEFEEVTSRPLRLANHGSGPTRRVLSLHNGFARSQTARRIVLDRSGGHCENPQCVSPGFFAINDTGDPILQVDHVHELGQGGEDHPRNMIALCPNCHAVKTYGAGRAELSAQLAQVAAELWDQMTLP